ncbi:MAG: serine/threonine-protein kinase [Candidatus Melainabacteria bacterium]|nr:serine/threonine-protein kinase [Candidatus Melainabacteria bacterium]
MAREQSTTCPICKKQTAVEAPGSLTSFLFQELRCTCNATEAASDRRAAPDFAHCQDCGRIVLEKAGSFTSFLFQDLCCHCSVPNEVKNEKLLSTRFQRTDRVTKSTALGSTRRWRSHDSDALTELQENEVIGGYRLIKQIGRGGMGIVFLAEYLPLNRICALKFLAPSMVSDKSWIMFQNEARIVAGLTHPTICQIYDMGVHDGRLPFYAMEYLEGESLESILITQRTMTVGAALEVFAKVAQGLSYAHRHGIVHKDIKPANVMLSPSVDGHVAVKILDFGIAELIDSKNEAPEKAPEDVIGSAFYMSPEQLKGAKLDQRSDIYSAGCSLFEALTGEPPFPADSRELLTEQHCNETAPTLQQRTDIKFPDELEAILKKTLAKLPEDRYQSADQLAEALEQMLTVKQPTKVESLLRDTLILNASTSTPPAALPGHWGVALVLAATGLFLGLGYFAVTFLVQSLSNAPPPQKKPAHRAASVKGGKIADDEKSARLSDSFLKSDTEKQYDKAVETTASKFNIANANAFIEAGLGLTKVEESQQALKNLERGLKLNPRLWTPEVSDALVKNFIDLSQFEKALTETNRGIEASPNHYRYRGKGQILCQLNRNTEALEYFTKATQMGPAEYWNYFDRGSCYLMLNKNDKALADFSKLIAMKPDDARGYSLRAKCYTRLGKPELAARDAKEAARLGHIQLD